MRAGEREGVRVEWRERGSKGGVRRGSEGGVEREGEVEEGFDLFHTVLSLWILPRDGGWNRNGRDGG